jgi:hypothetical protein
MGDGSAISAIQSSNVSDFGSNVTRIGTLETDLGDNSSRITNLSSNLSDNSSRITALESGDISISGDKTFTGDIIFESNIHMNGGNVFVANTVNMTVSDPIIELGLNNIGTNDLGIIMTRPAANSNVAFVYDESDDILRMGYTLNGASDSIVDLDSNALAVSVQGALSAGSNLEVGTANLFVDTTTSNVGVGVSSPAYKLDVGGDVNLSTGSTLRINGIPAVFSNWTVSGSDIYRSSGNVGIGTASPRGMLDIYTGATSTAGLIIDRYASGTYRSELYQESDGLAIKVGDGSNAPAENMRITRSDVLIPGRLALGTSTASSSQFYISAPGNGTSTSTGDFHINNSAGMTLYGTRPWITTTNGQGHTGKLCSINFHASGHQPAIEWTRDTGQGTNQRNWLLRQETDDALYTWHYDGSAWSIPMYVKSDAVISQVNVGIGTTNPTHQLHIGPKDNDHIYLASSNNSYGWTIDTDDQGSGTVPFRIIKRTDGVDSTVLTIKNQDGKVGIGTSNSPTELLHVCARSSSESAFIRIQSGSGGTNPATESGIKLTESGQYGFQFVHSAVTDLLKVKHQDSNGSVDKDDIMVWHPNGAVQWGVTSRYNFHYNPNTWGYSTNLYNTTTNFWSVNYYFDHEGYVFVTSYGHWTRKDANNSGHAGGNEAFYGWISVDNKEVADSSLYDNFSGSTSSYNKFHEYQSPDTSGAGAWRDFSHTALYKVSAGWHSFSLRVTVFFGSSHYLNINGSGLNGFYIPKHYL